ncbi:alpha/beta fold hydrolase [Streptomyces sp. NPDC007100]|uniref:alpha/beta fold hydrolase n=1 Tax=Streptomyces sp. NPDC007100 TaxID=3155602 RepID=UPI0033E12DB3
MTTATLNGIRLSYYEQGAGEPVVLVMGTGSGARAWNLHQVPALVAAGYRVVTFDNRGIPPTSECAGGFTLHEMVDDVLALVDHLHIAPARFVGTSMGAAIVQELALRRPDVVRQAVLMATRARSDVARSALARAELALADSGAKLPPEYQAVVRAMQSLSPKTLLDDAAVADWLDVMEFSEPSGPGLRAQLALDPLPDRLAAYRSISVPCHVISFADDLITPPEHGREVADAIPGASHELFQDCGHYGYLENPEGINRSILAFFQRPASSAPLRSH